MADGTRRARRATEAELTKALEEAAASLRLEDLEVTPEDKELVRRRLRGEISQEEFLRLAREQAREEAERSRSQR